MKLKQNSANNILFRPSSLGDIMSGTGKNWSVNESLTCQRRLIKIFRELEFNRYYNNFNKYIEKGLKAEEDGITLYSRYSKEKFVKNKTRFENEYFTGEPDIIFTNETIDIKCSWSLETFPHNAVDKPNADYIYQGIAYMDLTGAEIHTIAYCLVNAPANLIIREKEKLWCNMGCPDQTNENYAKEKESIERNMIFDIEQFNRDNPNFDYDNNIKEWVYDIPIKDRVVEYTVYKDCEMLQKVKNRIIECRKWMNENLYKQN